MSFITSGAVSQKALRSILPIRGQNSFVFETEGCILSDILLTVYTIEIYTYIVDHGSSWPLIRLRGNVIFYVVL